MRKPGAFLSKFRRGKAKTPDRERERAKRRPEGCLLLSKAAAQAKLSPAEVTILVKCGAIMLAPRRPRVPLSIPVSELGYLAAVQRHGAAEVRRIRLAIAKENRR